MTRLIDSHCHLDFDGLSNRLPEVLAAMEANDVGGCMTIGVTLEEAPQVLAIAAAYEQVFASVGVHPEYADHREPDVETLCALAQHPKVLAIGETGLDYHWHKDQPEWQRERFRVHIRAAKALNKPLVIHTREAAEDTLAILKEEGAGAVGGILHCFTESLAVAERAIDLGFYISISGIVSFKKAEQVHEVARAIPLDRLLVETDSPYLAPVPYRGKPNEPAYVRHVAEAIANLRQISYAEVATASSRNFLSLFPSSAAVLGPRVGL
ncbi:TatD family hydrolase [Fluviibacter phosphoraccumulans]|uniref:Deoxyribonuclease n=1 Tax=Fluviibacter phosphoraccumulans TaxID=1751046 RepID=A0A679I4U8_9RHOO|nr:TatD family hydrolase [Fluviibacter phosphoraccumulans]BBU69417.1 deoxyribonuclease [Fluviibacter phosphoraccumulans]BBU71400.1 deoxyribonuclease [Fluviibacter phosphoraccumulans]BCA65353.1 deoxyribonuclease [Fluviibacter phosphoraccumulans]